MDGADNGVADLPAGVTLHRLELLLNTRRSLLIKFFFFLFFSAERARGTRR